MSPYGLQPYGENGWGGIMTKEASVEVVLEEQGNLTVTVTDPGGNGLSGASVELSGTSSRSGETGSDGTIAFEGLRIGDYDVTVQKEGWFEKLASVSADDFA